MSNNKYKILVVEDDHNIASFIHTVLETNGYQVLLAERCRQGILMVSSHMPDLVLLKRLVRRSRSNTLVLRLLVRMMGIFR